MMKTKQQKNNSVTVVNKDQIQSYIMTTAKYDFSVYEKRILYRIVEMAQGELQGVRFATDCKKIEHTLFDTVHITMPIASLLNGESDENYTRVKQALLSLQKKIFTYEDEKEWISISIIALPNCLLYTSIVVHHVLGRRPCRFGDDGLQVGRQRIEGLLVDQQFEHRLRLLPARVVVILGRLVQAEGQVVVGADPVGGIDRAGLQRGENLAAGHHHGSGAEAAPHLSLIHILHQGRCPAALTKPCRQAASPAAQA